MNDKTRTKPLVTMSQCVNSEDYWRKRALKAEAESQELQSLFELQHKRTIEADKLWQKAHNSKAFPDLGELIAWLMWLSKSCKSCVNGPFCGSSPVCADCKIFFKNGCKGKDLWTPKPIKPV